MSLSDSGACCLWGPSPGSLLFGKLEGGRIRPGGARNITGGCAWRTVSRRSGPCMALRTKTDELSSKSRMDSSSEGGRGSARVLWEAETFMTLYHTDEEGLVDSGRSNEINNEPSNNIRQQPTGTGAEDHNCGRRIQERGGGAIRAGLST